MPKLDVKLTSKDHLILESYKTVLDGLADYLGSGYEFVLHSLENLEHSVIKIINGHYTGRKVGAPITDMALTMLDQIQKSGNEEYITYSAKNKKGEPLKSTTILIRGEKGRAIALLCINFYLNTPISEIITHWSVPEISSNKLQSINETFVVDTQELILKSVTDAKMAVEADASIKPGLYNKEIVKRLDSAGIFKLKDATVIVADKLGISKNTVYLHLRNLK